jgi:hypothetical protein
MPAAIACERKVPVLFCEGPMLVQNRRTHDREIGVI